ncbi:nucleotidyltransferase domain-containing protein [Pontibacillus yanchengensis]|uniref:nucleotidyltransferase domain-containing protein n=1 Tax=Pontibacillus yanchengensis TaxID=462910 RepID=UPI0005623066|nr:nucleotidyltransferase domain-containing protein [Pontibacillus yanchengensis]
MVPQQVESLLTEYTEQLNNLLNDAIKGVYLYGSLALDAFEEGNSDIDFITILNRHLSVEEEEKLQQLHVTLKNDYSFGDEMDGVYMLNSQIGKYNEELEAYLYCEEGEIKKGHWDINAVTWWVLEHHGVRITGPDIKELPLETSWNDVKKTLRYNTEHYWPNKKLIQLLGDEDALFAIETNARIFCTLDQERIVPKTEALSLLKEKIGTEWDTILLEGFHLRENHQDQASSYYSSPLMRAQVIMNFMEYIREECRSYYQLA